MQLSYKRANLLLATLCFLFVRKKYLSMAVSHGMAVKLEAADLRSAYEKGDWPKEDWEQEAMEVAEKAANHIQSKLVDSFIWVALGAAVAIGIGYGAGSLSITCPISHSKVVSFLGLFLASWATLMELGGALATFKGEALHELIHPVLFQILFIPGVAMALTVVVL